MEKHPHVRRLYLGTLALGFVWRHTIGKPQGNPATYQLISNTTDCGTLLTFSDTQWSIFAQTGNVEHEDYATAADDHARDLGCDWVL